ARAPQHAERATRPGAVEAGLRAEQAELGEAAGAAQLASEALPRARRQLARRHAHHGRRGEVDHARSRATLVTLPPNPARLNSTRRTALASPPEGARPSSGSGWENPAVGVTRPRASAASSSASSAGPLAPSVWPIAPLRETSRGGAPKTARNARASARSPVGLPPACSLTRSTSAGRQCASPSAARIARSMTCSLGAGAASPAGSIADALAAIRHGPERETSRAANASPS